MCFILITLATDKDAAGYAVYHRTILRTDGSSCLLLEELRLVQKRSVAAVILSVFIVVKMCNFSAFFINQYRLMTTNSFTEQIKCDIFYVIFISFQKS